MNAKLLLSVTDDAERIYREHFLRERYGLPAHDAFPATAGTSEDVDVIDVVGYSTRHSAGKTTSPAPPVSRPTMTKLRTRRPAASRPTTERSPREQITIVM